MQSAHRAVVAGVHRLQQIERLGAAHFADDDAFRAHTQAVAHQIAHMNGAIAFKIGRAGFEPHHVGLLQLQFRRVLAGDHPLVGIDVIG